MTPANDNASDRTARRPALFATTLRLLSSLDAMPEREPNTDRRRAESQ